MFKSLLLVMLGGILVNNYAFEKLLGVCPVLGGNKNEEKAAGTGIAVAIVMLVSSLIVMPVNNCLTAGGLEYLRIPALAAVILLVVFVLQLVFAKLSGKTLGGYLPLIALNAGVLVLCLNTAGLSFGETLFTALGAGIGYLFAMVIFEGVLSRIDTKYVPDAFKGLPINLVAAFIIAMALVAYK